MEDALIQKGILLLIAAARDVVFIMFNNTRTSFRFGPTATSRRDLVRFSSARLTLNINFSSLNQCWPGRKKMDLNSIKVRTASFHFPRLFIFNRLHTCFDVRQSHITDDCRCALISEAFRCRSG